MSERERTADRGFTLVEVMIAMALVLVVLMAGLAALTSSFRAVVSDTASTRGTQLVNEVHEEIDAVPWNSLGFYETAPGYRPQFEGFDTVKLTGSPDPRALVLKPEETITRGTTAYTVRIDIVTTPSADLSDPGAHRRISVRVDWRLPDGAARSVRADRTRASATAAKGLETFALRSLDAVQVDTSTTPATETLDPFRLTPDSTMPPGTSLVVRVTTNLAAGGVSLSYTAVDAAGNAVPRTNLPMTAADGTGRSWTYTVPAGERFKGAVPPASVAPTTFTATGWSSWNPALTSRLDTFVAFLDPVYGWTRLSLGTAIACRVNPSAQVWCWGANHFGQMGNDLSSTATTPVQAGATTAGFTDIVSVSTGAQHVCAVTRSGELFCWGNGTDGQLGVPAPLSCGSLTMCSRTPLRVPLSQVAAVSAGTAHTCATTWSGRLFCWGRGASGQLGTGSTANVTAPQPVALSDGSRAYAVAAGIEHTCAVDGSGRVWCWGLAATNRLNDLATSRTTPGVTAVTGALTISASHTNASSSTSNAQSTTCVTSLDGAVGCWGSNGSGQIGAMDSTLSPVNSTSTTVRWASTDRIPGAAVQVTAGAAHACTVTLNTTTSVRWQGCWGSNSQGQFGTGSTTPSANGTPVQATGLPAAPIAVAASETFTCAGLADNSVWCWGTTTQEALGNGTGTTGQNAYGEVSSLPRKVSGT